MEKKISPAVWQRVRSGYAAVKPAGLPADFNPVEKIALHVFEVDSQLHIEELHDDAAPMDDDDDDDDGDEPPPLVNANAAPPLGRRRRAAPALVHRRGALRRPTRVVQMSNQSQLRTLGSQVRQLSIRQQEHNNQHQAAISTLHSILVVGSTLSATVLAGSACFL